MEMNIKIAKTRVIDIAPIDTQSPWRGNRFPTKICIKKARSGKNRMNNEYRMNILSIILSS